MILYTLLVVLGCAVSGVVASWLASRQAYNAGRKSVLRELAQRGVGSLVEIPGEPTRWAYYAPARGRGAKWAVSLSRR